MTTDTTDRRLIASTWAGTDMADRDHADTLRELIDAIPRTAYVRRSETYPQDNWYALGFVAEYTDPATGDTRWVEYYSDDTGGEFADHATRESAEAGYEANVRNLASTADDDSPWWDATDVDGVATRED